MKVRFTFFMLMTVVVSIGANAKNKSDRKVMKQLQTNITFLASDDLEGRRTGTNGETKAAKYIIDWYKKLGIKGYKGQYKYPFQFTYGREIAKTCKISLNGEALKVGEDVFPLPYSASTKFEGSVLPDVTEKGSIWVLPVYNSKEQSEDPHFDAEKNMYDMAKEAARGGATGVFFFNSFDSKYEPVFNNRSEQDLLEIPVTFMTHAALKKYLKNDISQSGSIRINMDVTVNKTERTGNNIAVFIDNGAPYTVILGAHYDHLGYGEDGNSLYANAKTDRQIHHGADDNASGTAALMEVAEYVQTKHLTGYNYLFVHFSGEELGLFGSKAFVKDQKIDSNKIAFMLNMDMVGRLNDTSRSLTIGGVGTSPQWSTVVEMGKKDFKVVIDSAGVGPSDHTSFYQAGIPVLFLFTGQHKDYHKPTDRAEFINYKGEVEVLHFTEDILDMMDATKAKPKFTHTRQITGGRSKYKVTMGIMPDYTYHDGGVKVDGVTDGKPASRAGVHAGDIIVQMGEIKIESMTSYMEALGKFAPGDKTNVKVKRDGQITSLPLEFNK